MHLTRPEPPARLHRRQTVHWPPKAEWAGAERYEAMPGRLVIGVDRVAGRDFVSVGLATVEKQARAWGTRR